MSFRRYLRLPPHASQFSDHVVSHTAFCLRVSMCSTICRGIGHIGNEKGLPFCTQLARKLTGVIFGLQASSVPNKGFLSAYDILKMSPFDTPPSSDSANVLRVSPVGEPPLRARSPQDDHRTIANSPSPCDTQGSRNNSPSEASSTTAQTPQHNSFTKSPSQYGEDEVCADSIDSVADGAEPLHGVNNAYVSQKEEGLLPPSWMDLLQAISDLPLPSNTKKAAEAAIHADQPPPTTIGLMVKPDPEHHDFGLVMGFVEGSSADLSKELMVGDVVLAVDGTPFNHPEALKLMRGGQVVVSAGTQLRLTIEREGSGVFECTLTREPYTIVQLKRELFELLSRFKEALRTHTFRSQNTMSEDDHSKFLLEAVRSKLVELERSNSNSLQLLRSELQGVQQVMEQIVEYIKHAASEGDETIRAMKDCIEAQDDQIQQLSEKMNILLPCDNHAAHSSGKNDADHQSSHDQVHLLRHECNRLRSSLQNKESELEGLRDRFNKNLDEQGLREVCEGTTEGQQCSLREQSELGTLTESVDDEEQLEQERISNDLAMAAIKRDLWVSVIRRWLNNCCRRVITGWRNELARKTYYAIICNRLGQNYLSRCNRRRTKCCFAALTFALFESKRLRHAGVTAASGWLFLGVRKHLRAWLAHVDWKAYAQRLESKHRAKSAAVVFHSWSRVVVHSAPGLDSEMVAAIMSPNSDACISPNAIVVMADAKKALKCAQHRSARSPIPSKSAVFEKSAQTLRWESDASVQCSLEKLESDHLPQVSICPLAPSVQPCVSNSSMQTEAPYPTSTTLIRTSTTGTQSETLDDVICSNRIAAETRCDEQHFSAFAFRSLQEKLDSEQMESRRLRDKLAIAHEAVVRHEDFLKSAQDSDRRLKEGLQIAQAQLNRALKNGDEDRRRACQLGQELEQVERKLLMAHEERNELRTLVSDERRKNARGNAGNLAGVSNSHSRVANIPRRTSQPSSHQYSRQDQSSIVTVPVNGANNASKSVPDHKAQLSQVCR